MRPRPFAVLALLGLLGVLGAAPASGASTVYVRGRVVDPAGRPVAGARVSFELHPDRTLYNQSDCPMRPTAIECRVHKVAGSTDAAGRYRLPVRLTSYLASTREHHLFVTDRPLSGVRVPARTHITTYFPRKNLDLADLPVWRTRVTIEPDGPVHRMLHVDPLPARLGRRYSSGPVAELLQGGDVAWRLTDVDEDRRVDARVVEAGTTAIRAVEKGILGRLFPTYTSSAYAVSPGVRPVSRGAGCLTYGAGDKALPLPGCRFTDGKLAAPIDQRYQQANGQACNVASACSRPRWLTVTLAEVSPVGAVAVRGCVPAAAEFSVEGVAFAPYPFVDSGDGLLVGAPVPARYVRVDLARCLFKATEVSLFR